MCRYHHVFRGGDVPRFRCRDNLQQVYRPRPPVEELILPGDFKWGVATAVLQIEGGADQDGKGKSIWDTFSHMNPSRTNNENPDVSCDHYNLWEEDVELMSNLGADVYRFSIAWSRVIPLGSRNDPVNEKGIEFYSNLIDKLLAKNIAPVVTLYHWDAPQGLCQVGLLP